MVNDAAATFPVRVAVLAVLVKETPPVVEKPAMLGVALVPPIVIVDALAVKVPLLVKLPFSARAKLFAADVLRVPDEIVRSPLMEVAAPSVVVPDDIVRLLKVAAAAGRLKVPVNITVPAFML